MQQSDRDRWIEHWEKRRQERIVKSGELAAAVAHHHFAMLASLLERSGALERGGGRTVALLDAGSGTGEFTMALTLTYSARFDITLLDISAAALAIARATVRRAGLEDGRNRFAFLEGDLLNLPFLPETFDVVWNGGVMEHFSGEARSQVFREIARVLRRGGVYVCIVPNRYSPLQYAWLRYTRMTGRHDVGFQQDFSISELRRRMTEAGLRVTTVDGIDPWEAAMTVFGGLRSRQRRCEIPRHRFPLDVLSSIIGSNIGVCAMKPGTSQVGRPSGDDERDGHDG